MFEIFEKKVDGVTVGFFIGVQCYSRWRGPKKYVRNIRHGLIFKTQKKAQEYWDKMESKRRTIEVTKESVARLTEKSMC